MVLWKGNLRNVVFEEKFITLSNMVLYDVSAIISYVVIKPILEEDNNVVPASEREV